MVIEDKDDSMKHTATEWLKTGVGLVFRCLGGRGQILPLIAISLLALLPCVSPATEYTWKGTSNGNWGTAANWSPSSDTPSGAGDTAVFDGSGANLNTINSTRALKAISFTAGQTSTVNINTRTNAYINFSVSGNTISVAAGYHKVIGTGDGSSGSTYDLQFPASSTNNINSGASFEIQGRIRGGGSDFTKIGGGTLILAGHNGNTGGWQAPLVRIQEGVLRLAAAGAAGHSGNNFIVASGAALEITNNISLSVGTGTWTLNDTGISGSGALRSRSTGTSTLSTSSSGSIVLGSSSSIGVDSGTLNISRVISGADKALTKVGSGTLKLTATNTYTGATIVEAGTLSLGANSTLSGSSAVTLSDGTLAVGSYSNAVSTLTLSGAATIDLDDGTGHLGFADSHAVGWTGGSTLTITGTFVPGLSLRFGTTSGGLTADQLALISAVGFSDFSLTSNGYLTATRGTVFRFR